MISAIERGAGKVLRLLMAYLALVGVVMSLGALVTLNPLYLQTLVFALPYAIIKLRDRRGRWEVTPDAA